MSAPTLALVRRQPGELVLDPTNLSSAFPYGGTRLGYTVDGFTFQPNIGIAGVSGEPGISNYEYRYLGSDVRASCALRQWDDDGIQKAFPDGLNVAGTHERVVEMPGTLAEGSLFTAFKLLFVPQDRVRNKFCLFRNAIGVLEGEVRFSAQEDSSLLISWLFTDDTSLASGNARYNSRLAQIGLLEDLTL